MSLERPSWDEWALGLAFKIAERADCSRRQVGAVILDAERRISGGGYNGSYSGGPSCLAGDCPRASSGVTPGSSYDTGVGTCHAVHSEINAVLYTDRDRRDTLYCTDQPCQGCEKQLRNSGLRRVVWPDGELNFG
jgi:dCMP deaminase